MKSLFRSQHLIPILGHQQDPHNHLHHYRHHQRLLISCCFDFNIDHRGPSRDFQEVFCQQSSFKRPSGCVLCSRPWFCCDIKHQSWGLCSLAGASIGPVATSISLSCFRIRVPFHWRETWFFCDVSNIDLSNNGRLYQTSAIQNQKHWLGVTEIFYDGHMGQMSGWPRGGVELKRVWVRSYRPGCDE